ncbi:transcriptional regulator [Thioclava sp. SK-1]|uniref:FMN-binding negative transcriptional regulator n=1 Tax=Thioclava sp. SK-1 TaxID=1889770 RepID=UPI0008267232|nr:FMN-binding negative transcriptional regulator [Thioclava sp. SK-1]OCX64632.1 transcriptional regulator [Thioclava sp. SK-1]
MYRPPAFAETRREVLHHAIAQIRLAALVTPHDGGIDVSHVPMLLRDTGKAVTLETHVARGNPHWRRLAQDRPSVAIFQGPQAYISPSFYPTKAETGKVVPTWTYIAVHAHGQLRAVQDRSWLAQHLHDLTQASEANMPQPWSVDDAPREYLNSLERGIVGLQFSVDRLEGAWKINQHKSEADRRGTADGLAASGAQGAALAAVLAQTFE